MVGSGGGVVVIGLFCYGLAEFFFFFFFWWVLVLVGFGWAVVAWW